MRSHFTSIGQRGVSLIELAAASAIGVLIVSSAIFAYSSSLRNYRLQTQQIQIGENAQYALEVLRRDVRMAGYRGLNVVPGTTDTAVISNTKNGCMKASHRESLLYPVSSTYDVGRYAKRCIDPRNYHPQTDILQINSVVGDTVELSGLKNGKMYLRASLASGLMFSAVGGEALDQNSINTITESPALTNQFASRIYYIRKCSDPTSSGVVNLCDRDDDSIPTLVRITVSGTSVRKEPMVEFIDGLIVLLAVDNSGTHDGSPGGYLSGDNVTDLNRVVAVELNLLARSAGSVGNRKTGQVFKVGSRVIYRNDKFHRKMFTETVYLRNSQRIR